MKGKKLMWKIVIRDREKHNEYRFTLNDIKACKKYADKNKTIDLKDLMKGYELYKIIDETFITFLIKNDRIKNKLVNAVDINYEIKTVNSILYCSDKFIVDIYID